LSHLLKYSQFDGEIGPSAVQNLKTYKSPFGSSVLHGIEQR